MSFTETQLRELCEKWSAKFKELMPDAKYVWANVLDEKDTWIMYPGVILNEQLSRIDSGDLLGEDTLALNSIGLSEKEIESLDGEEIMFEVTTGKMISSNDPVYRYFFE